MMRILFICHGVCGDFPGEPGGRHHERSAEQDRQYEAIIDRPWTADEGGREPGGGAAGI